MYKILIVEDDRKICELLIKQLGGWGFAAKGIDDFNNVLEEMEAYEPHLILLDITLPFYNGFHWCTTIRKQYKTPIIFLSSASDNMNIVMAMNMGGDDFISKPFDINVLVAKIQATLRRVYDYKDETNTIEYKGLVLNADDASITINDNKIDLTKNEFKVLSVLLQNRGKIVSRDVLMQKLWETDEFVDDNTLTVNVTRLRHKLEDAGLDNYITTKKGIGYLV